jgi:two-component system, cell cycle response regulator
MPQVPIDLDRIFKLQSLPSLPTAAVKLIDIWKSETASLEEISAAIKSDPALSARIIKAANSPYFGLRSQVNTIERAAIMLGRNVLATMSLTFSLAEQSVVTGAIGHHYRNYWRRSLLLAAATEVLTDTSNRDQKSRAFLDGLMSDIGQLALLRTMPKEYGALLDEAKSESKPLVVLEREYFGITHAEVGARLAEKWGLEAGLVEVVRCHHMTLPELAEISPNDPTRVKTSIVAAALEQYVYRNGRACDGDILFQVGRGLLNLTDDELVLLPQKIRPRVTEAFQMLDVDADDLPDPTTIMALANQQLAELTIRAQSEAVEAVAQTRALEEENRQLSLEKNLLESQLVMDALTGVNTRSFFQAFLEKEISRALRSRDTVGVIFCDIDHFKKINDNYGHQAGDAVLRAVAQSLMADVRQNDVVARYGGEEFVIMAVMPQIDGLRSLCERLRASVEKLVVRSQNQEIRPTISIGACVTVCSHDIPELAALIIQQADDAMYEAKRAGRNRVQFRNYESVLDIQASLPDNSSHILPTQPMGSGMAAT